MRLSRPPFKINSLPVKTSRPSSLRKRSSMVHLQVRLEGRFLCYLAGNGPRASGELALFDGMRRRGVRRLELFTSGVRQKRPCHILTSQEHYKLFKAGKIGPSFDFRVQG